MCDDAVNITYPVTLQTLDDGCTNLTRFAQATARSGSSESETGGKAEKLHDGFRWYFVIGV